MPAGSYRVAEPNHYQMRRPYQQDLDLGGDLDDPTLNAVQVAGTESEEWKDCSGKYVINISPELSGSNVTGKIRVILRDKNKTVGRIYSPSVKIGNTGRQEDIRTTGYYHGAGEQCLTFGASWYKIMIPEAPTNSGFITVFTDET